MILSEVTKRNHAILKAKEILDDHDKYIIVDTETSGLGDRAEVLEICAMNLQEEVVLECFLMPTGTISPEAIAIHGLTKEVLQQKGAITWDNSADKIKQALAGKIMLAYNSSFDQKMIMQTAALYGYDSPVKEAFCIMRLRQQFTGTKNTEKLGGDHTAQGDCRQTLRILQEIANAEIEEDPENLEINNNDDLVSICLELEEISAQRLNLSKREEIIKTKCGLYLKEMEINNMSLNNGQQVERIDSITKVKPKVSLEELADDFKTTSINHRFVKKLWQQGKLNNSLFDYVETWSIKIKKH
jgi:hypothetical protein